MVHHLLEARVWGWNVPQLAGTGSAPNKLNACQLVGLQLKLFKK